MLLHLLFFCEVEMAISLIPCFKQDGDSISVAWERVSVLVPEVYFTEPAIAEDLNGRVSTIFFLELLALDKKVVKNVGLQ